MARLTCKHCGDCCRNNGLIPPALPGDGSPEWLVVLVQRLREKHADEAKNHPCIFLYETGECLIYEHRPAVCREFECDNTTITGG